MEVLPWSEKIGIYPLKTHVYPDHLFLPREVTKNVVEMMTKDTRRKMTKNFLDQQLVSHNFFKMTLHCS